MDNHETEIAVTNYLHAFGMKRSNVGFHYLRTAIMACVEEPLKMLSVVNLYRHIATKYQSTASKVERGIRHSIFLTGDKSKNSEFIAQAADTIRLGMAKK